MAVSASATCAPRTWGRPEPRRSNRMGLSGSPMNLSRVWGARPWAVTAAPTPPSSPAACPWAAGDRAPGKASALSGSRMGLSTNGGAGPAEAPTASAPRSWPSRAWASRRMEGASPADRTACASAACPRAAGDRAPRKASALSASPMAVSGPPSRAGAWRALFTPRFTPAPWRSHAGASRQRPWPAEPCRSGLAFGSQRLASGPRRRSRSALASRREPKGLRELRLYNRLLSGYVRPQPTLPINHCIDQYCTSRYQATL